MAIAANALVQIQLIGSCFGQRIILTHWLSSLVAFPAINTYTDDLNAVLDQLAMGAADDYVTPYLALMPQQYAIFAMTAQAITPVRSVKVTRAINPPASGTHASPATVANDAAVLTFRTDLGGRNQVSNRHIGPVPDSVSDQGLIIPAYRLLMGTFATRLLSPVAPVGLGGNMDAVVPHVKTGTKNVLKTFVAQDTSRVMRRRTVRVGE